MNNKNIPSPLICKSDIALANTEIKKNPQVRDTTYLEDLWAQMDNQELE